MVHQAALPSIAELDPLIISAPAVRSGTTLIQRLLCSSSAALIYGETSAQDLDMLLQIYTARSLVYTYNRQQFDATLQTVLAGRVDDWILDLMPPIDGYLDQLAHGCFAGVAHCRSYAAQLGRPIWGFKYPGWQPHTLRTLRHLMPRARLIYIHRNVADCLRSAKAEQLVNSEQEAALLCQTWAENLSYVHSIRAEPTVMILSYAELVSEPIIVLERLAAFSGVSDIRESVLERRINTRGAGYTPPAALTHTEEQLAAAAAALVPDI